MKIPQKSVLKMDGYDIAAGQNIFNLLGAFAAEGKFSSVIILSDETVFKLYGAQIKNVLPDAKAIIIPPGEKQKNLNTLAKIWRKMFRYKADRHTLLVNLGGGVICDMGGFAASAYMRGIKFAQIPTTLLSQVDASAGGKTAVDLDGAKNIIGAFYNPSLVLIDVNVLKTLPPRELQSGFAEILKHGLIKDKKYFEEAAALSHAKMPPEKMIKLIQGSNKIKSRFVKLDREEKGPRKILNFGHTFGHAVETLSMKTKRPLLHGEAVALGMIAEAKLSVLEAGLSEEEFTKIKSAVKNHGLPLKYKQAKKSAVLNLITKDKKNKGQTIKWTLLNRIGKAIYDEECNPQNVSAALEEIL